MSTSYSVRRLSAAEIPTHLDSLCDVLTDCVEGGASVSFMLPFSVEKARAFWLDVAKSTARDERLVLAAFDAQGKPSAPYSLFSASRKTSRTARTSQNCWYTDARVGPVLHRR